MYTGTPSRSESSAARLMAFLTCSAVGSAPTSIRGADTEARRDSAHLDTHWCVDVPREPCHELVHEAESRLDLGHSVWTLRRRRHRAWRDQSGYPPGRERLLDGLAGRGQSRFHRGVVAPQRGDKKSTNRHPQGAPHERPPSRRKKGNGQRFSW